jgi:hypothetical protein
VPPPPAVFPLRPYYLYHLEPNHQKENGTSGEMPNFRTRKPNQNKKKEREPSHASHFHFHFHFLFFFLLGRLEHCSAECFRYVVKVKRSLSASLVESTHETGVLFPGGDANQVYRTSAHEVPNFHLTCNIKTKGVVVVYAGGFNTFAFLCGSKSKSKSWVGLERKK